MPRFRMRYVFEFDMECPSMGDTVPWGRERLAAGLKEDRGYMTEYRCTRLDDHPDWMKCPRCHNFQCVCPPRVKEEAARKATEALFGATSKDLGEAAVREAKEEHDRG